MLRKTEQWECDRCGNKSAVFAVSGKDLLPLGWSNVIVGPVSAERNFVEARTLVAHGAETPDIRQLCITCTALFRKFIERSKNEEAT